MLASSSMRRTVRGARRLGALDSEDGATAGTLYFFLLRLRFVSKAQIWPISRSPSPIVVAFIPL